MMLSKSGVGKRKLSGSEKRKLSGSEGQEPAFENKKKNNWKFYEQFFCYRNCGWSFVFDDYGYLDQTLRFLGRFED